MKSMLFCFIREPNSVTYRVYFVPSSVKAAILFQLSALRSFMKTSTNLKMFVFIFNCANVSLKPNNLQPRLVLRLIIISIVSYSL